MLMLYKLVFLGFYFFSFIDFFFYFFFIIIPLLLAIAFFTLSERKVMASIQRRIGPNIVGFWGFLQPFADALKLLVKEIIIPSKAHKFFFLFSPFLCLFFSFLAWFPIVFNPFVPLTNLSYGVLFNLIVSSCGVYGIFLAGWSSNSNYAFMGSLRGICLLISYEVAITIVILPIVLIVGSLNYNYIILEQVITIWYIFPFFPLGICFFICSLAETNRIPFDLAEAEAELIAGYNVEYGGFLFALFFLSEYGAILLMCVLFVCFFIGGGDFFFYTSFFNIKHFIYFFFYDIVFSIKVMLLSFLFIFLRANLPRYRFDQLILVGWKVLLPVALGFFLFYNSLFFYLHCLAVNEIPYGSIGFRYILFSCTQL